MSRRKLPSAIQPASETTPAAALGIAAMAAPPPAPMVNGRATMPRDEPAPPRYERAPPHDAPSPSLKTAAGTAPNTTERRARAEKLVARHARYSAVGGLLPVPIANVAGVTAIIVRMVKALSDLYGVPFERDRARAMIVGLMGGTVPTGLATTAASTLVYVVPGSALIGLAVSSAAALACTRSIGRVFVEHFESGTVMPVPAPQAG